MKFENFDEVSIGKTNKDERGILKNVLMNIMAIRSIKCNIKTVDK